MCGIGGSITYVWYVRRKRRLKAKKESEENYDISVVDTSTSRMKSKVSLRQKHGEEEKSGSEFGDDGGKKKKRKGSVSDVSDDGPGVKVNKNSNLQKVQTLK